MSREYGCWCPYCRRNNAREMGQDDIMVHQCQDCGVCWKTVETPIKLKAVGTIEVTWARAWAEVFGRKKP
jgi:hypothetical protein